jgi:hypothetical protein
MTSESHRAYVDDDGLLRVYSAKSGVLVETTFERSDVPDLPVCGVQRRITSETAASPAEKNLAAYFARTPVFQAVFTGKRWEVDCDCGAQRWAGTMTRRRIAAALQRAGFSAVQARTLLDEVKKFP